MDTASNIIQGIVHEATHCPVCGAALLPSGMCPNQKAEEKRIPELVRRALREMSQARVNGIPF